MAAMRAVGVFGIVAAGVLWPVSPVFASSPELMIPVRSGSVEPAARFVVGPVVTVKEAQEATSDLKQVVGQLCLLSPTAVGWFPETSIATDDVPIGFLRALELLNQSTKVQNAVASVASDPYVWNAVMNNHAVVELLESQRSTTTELQEKVDESGADSGPGFADVMQNIKLRLLKIVSSVGEILQSIFGISLADHKEEADRNSKFSVHDVAEAGPLLGLALVVMIVALLKRA